MWFLLFIFEPGFVFPGLVSEPGIIAPCVGCKPGFPLPVRQPHLAMSCNSFVFAVFQVVLNSPVAQFSRLGDFPVRDLDLAGLLECPVRTQIPRLLFFPAVKRIPGSLRPPA